LTQILKIELNRTWMTRLGYFLARRAYRALADKMDPRKSNGGVFLGLNGIVIKSHGGTDAEGFAYAVDVGYDLVRHEMLAKIGQTLASHPRAAAAPRRAGGSGS
jgi:glycerol-3-phosphate acyltransferase PlsX